MPAKEIAVEEWFNHGDACVTCGESVSDISRGVIHRRLLYHGPCWLQIMSAAPGAQAEIATLQS